MAKKTGPLADCALVLSDGDNIAVAKTDIARSSVLEFPGGGVIVLERIPKGHRFAIKDIKKGAMIVQYGYPFGRSKGINRGELISRDKLASWRSDYRRLDKRPLKDFKGHGGNVAPDAGLSRTFMGYLRKDGRVGTRNFYLLVPTSLCAADIAVKLSSEFKGGALKGYRNIDGVNAAAHTEGCGSNDGEIIERLLLTLKNTILHPNVGGALVIDLGCEKIGCEALSRYMGGKPRHGKPVDFISIQALGGTGKALKKGSEIIRKRLKEVNSIKRKDVPVSRLAAGTECGASDTFSGITANPVIGWVVDRLIASGGSAILSETPEMLGAEAALIMRMRSKKTVRKFIDGLDYYNGLARRLSVSMEGNFVAGNIKGGLLTPALKSLGAILKGGSAPIVDFLGYGETLKEQGLSIMNGPGNDLESMTGISASGANIILFSTGMGATEGNLTSPVIKISSTTELFESMGDDIDFDAGRLLDEGVSMDRLGGELFELMVDVASGKKTRAEVWDKRSFQIWSAGKLSL
ncbi:MAG: altronate dehydratase [Deltaproteobacteria bacterium]|nr:altronate dehydratase [Deltaproteobacteria bacterium]